MFNFSSPTKDAGELGGVLRDALFSVTGTNRSLSAIKIARQCPLVLVVKVVWIEGKALGS
jgi:hypothetical protein